MLFSKTFLVSINKISISCTKPMQVLETMKRAMTISLELEKSRNVVSLLFSLRKSGVGTAEVENCSRRMCTRMQGKQKSLVKRLMTWKISDAIRCRRKAQYDNTKIWREARRYLSSEGVVKRYEALWREEKERYCATLREVKCKKVTCLVGKYGIQKEVPGMVRGVTVGDQKVPVDFTCDPRLYGGVELTDSEEKMLNLAPKFAVYENVNVEECFGEIEKGLAKLRWSREYRDSEENRKEYFDQVTKTFNFGNMRACDQPFNKRIQLPKPLPDEEEVELQVVRNRLRTVTEHYINIERGERKGNLSKAEKDGLKTLTDKVKGKNVVVFETDKSGRFSVDTPENYKLASQLHVNNDEVICPAVVAGIERSASAHSQSWSRILNIGGNWNQSDRVRRNMISSDSPLAPVYTLRKDHKPYGDGFIGPPTRPVCGVDASLNERLSWILSCIYRKVWQEDVGGSVCLSTEELLAEAKRVNDSNPSRPLVVGSADVKALYPSLDIDFTVDKCCEVLHNSVFDVEDVNYDELGLYLAYEYQGSRAELKRMKLDRVCPTRKFPKSKSLSLHSSGVAVSLDNRWMSWKKSRWNPTLREKRSMLIEGLRVALKWVMHNHVYVFDGVTRRQRNGGPIGLQLTGDIAQVFMLWWDRQMKAKLSTAGLELLTMKRYVDDINTISYAPSYGMRFRNGCVVVDPSCVEQDKMLEDDERFFRLFRSLGDSIHPSIKLEVDFPNNHDDKKVPILDVKMWTEKVSDNKYRVMHEFYMKDVSSKSVVHARSALPWDVKRTVLTQEILRVLVNCSVDLPWDQVVVHLNDIMARMQFSGYQIEFRYQVLCSAFSAYDRLVALDADGTRPMYRPSGWKREERVKSKRDKKVNWYKKGGFESVIFVPATPKSALQKDFQRVLRGSGTKIRVVERAGNSLKSYLQRSNPFRLEKCGRDNCFLCSTNGNGNCTATNVTYEIKCKACAATENPVRHRYVGETSRNAYCRGKEHMEGLRGKRDASVFWKHCKEVHDSEEVDFEMSVLGRYKNDCMMRQIMEAVSIESVPERELLNERTEWNNVRVPRTRVVFE